MIRFSDSLKLAYTKIRTRKVRLVISVLTASLLFAGLTGGSLIFSGIMTSTQSFSNEGFANRYIVAGSHMDTSMFTGPQGEDPALIARAETLYKAEQVKKKAEAKRLGIDYQENEADKAVNTSPDGTKYLNSVTAIGQQVLLEKQTADPSKVDMAAFQKQLGSGPTKYYQSRTIASSGALYNSPTFKPLLDGKEIYETNNNPDQQFGMIGMTKGLAGISDSWTLTSKDLVTPFLFDGQNFERGSDGSIPIIISYSAAQEVLKLSTLDNKATLQQRKERLTVVRRDVAGKTFDVCYRNSASSQNLQNAVQQQADLKQNGSKKDYVKPELLYGLPGSPCAEPVVQRDVRSADTKRYDAKVLEFNRQFGTQVPHSEILRFRIVGVTPDRSFPMGMPSIEDLLSLVATSTLGASWVSPIDIYESSPAVQDMFRLTAFPSAEPQQKFMAEYTSSSEARAALSNLNCIVQYPGMPLEAGQVGCSKKTRPFTLQSFGSASLTLEEITDGFRRFQLIAAAVIAAIASLILMGMIGRIISDSRKETAVFRAVGASRLAVSQIYVTYTVYLVVLIVVASFAVGLGLALLVDGNLGGSTGITMAMLFNVKNLDKAFHYYAFNWYDSVLIICVVGVAALLGAMIPILRNMRRNPIRDMRDE
ncbi:MAG: ABC transporter permease [Candidatus Saccharimonadales bacterium]